MLGFNDTSMLLGHLCHLPEKGRKQIVAEIKERNREERGTGMKVETEEIKTFPLYPYLLQE